MVTKRCWSPRKIRKQFEISDVSNMLYYCLVDKPEKKDDRCSCDDGVHASRGSTCAFLLLWFSMPASSPYLTRPAPLPLLLLTLSSNRFSFSPVPKHKMLHGACGADLKNKNASSGRVRSVSSPPVDGQSPPSFVVESSLLPASSLHANRDCAVVWLVVAPASTHEHPD